MLPSHTSQPDTLALHLPVTDRATLQRVQLKRKVILAGVILLFIGAAAITRPLWEGTAWNRALAAAGQLSVFVAIVGRGWCSLYIGGRKTREIVARGPYSISRNPLYVFSFLAAFGIGAQTGSLVLSIAALALTVLVFRATVLREEAWLSTAFGAEYDAYLAGTPRFWPRWSLWRDEALLEIDPARFVRTVLDGSVLLLALPLLAALTEARVAGLVPTLLTLP